MRYLNEKNIKTIFDNLNAVAFHLHKMRIDDEYKRADHNCWKKVRRFEGNMFSYTCDDEDYIYTFFIDEEHSKLRDTIIVLGERTVDIVSINNLFSVEQMKILDLHMFGDYWYEDLEARQTEIDKLFKEVRNA